MRWTMPSGVVIFHSRFGSWVASWWALSSTGEVSFTVSLGRSFVASWWALSYQLVWRFHDQSGVSNG